ncbi:ATP-binding cassette domain-containing protein [Amycolatopsis taiwanensis]|uniref:Daunorubicin resistance protein DrrA family ABC transporter ATP-binding protein n=1 Tax=Amycolatopsis taiwanensis TaxID=342230 RepID=A0A9W6QX89_9PSEU|nr:ATP-binding cassette domain-containing protein [Amycolatopsis taiwanensis]GLY65403.1 daunorubicin resistance protein DrrA family ABC transporter ATP-binding protein [Amycolatopsis taiwanensis]
MPKFETDVAIEARGVRKRYRSASPTGRPALDGLELKVTRGSVHGLLGPNGAGKTTAVRIMVTLLDHDEGEVRVAGYDVRRQARQVRRRIGLVGQYAAVDEDLSGRQNLVMFGRLCKLSPRAARRRADELLERFGLAEAGAKQVKAYSGGMRRRIDLAASLIVAPEILFVDEPTVGLDPTGRRDVWDAIRNLVRGGTTVLLTTQYLEEADQLADRISLLARGRVVAGGTPAELKARVGDDWFEITPHAAADLPRLENILGSLASGEITTGTDRARVPVLDRTRSLFGITAALRDAGVTVDDFVIRTPTLDEVFTQLTGAAATERTSDPLVPLFDSNGSSTNLTDNPVGEPS